MAVLPEHQIVGQSLLEPSRDSAIGWAGGVRLQSLGNLAHELRSPLQALFGYIDLLRDEALADGKRHRHIIERMNINMHDLARTVENMLEFAADPAQTDAGIEENIDLLEMLAEMAPALEAANQANRNILRIEMDSAPRVIRSRRRALHAILSNLVSNAVKFTVNGRVTLTISEGSALASGAILIEVRDTGSGMDPELVSRAFDPMVQLSESAARSHRGLGLGLAVVRRNVDALRGTLAVCSAPEGTCFSISIPCCIVPEPTISSRMPQRTFSGRSRYQGPTATRPPGSRSSTL